MWERFSFYGMRALLILYLVNALRWDTASAANLYGTYTMSVYLTPIIGGYLADRFIGTRRSLVIGGIIIALGMAILGSHGEERRRVIALFIVAFFVVFFWAAYDQSGSSMSLFADRNTNLRLGSMTIRSSWFQSVNPAVILLFAPVFAWLWVRLGKSGYEPSTALKMVVGLALLGVGFVFLVIGGRHADNGALVSPLWLVAAFAFHTWGELCLSPVGLSYVTKVAPVRFASLLMGVWFLGLRSRCCSSCPC